MIEVRALHEHAEFVDAVNLQQLIWGFEDVELLPVRLFVTASKIGGQAFGAYDNDRTDKNDRLLPGDSRHEARRQCYLHSHMLGVLKEYRDAGVGRMLKLEQRKDALARGIELIEWTFDPLEIKNAYFNIERLGAIVRRFVLNQYGTTTSRLHAGLPTDRCIAEWWLASDRVAPRSRRRRQGRPRRNRRAHFRPDGDLPDQGNRSRAGSRNSRARQRSVSRKLLERARGHRLRTHAGNRDISIFDMAFQIDRIVLRQIRMPLVHFFETSFGRTYERDIVLVEVVVGRPFRLGRSHRRRESLLQRRVDRIGMADRPRLRRAARSEARFRRCVRRWRIAPRTFAGIYMARGGVEAAVWDLEARREGRSAGETDRRRRAHRNPLRRFHRHSGFGRRSSSRKSRRKSNAGYQRIKMKIKPGWDIDVIREVRADVPDDPADGRREFRLHARRRGRA